MKNARNKQFINFKLGAITLSSVMKSCAILICPVWYINHPFVQVSCSLVTQKPFPIRLTAEVSQSLGAVTLAIWIC